jgi:hypothetical protein
MARYPDLPNLFTLKDQELRDMYNTIERWGAALINELDTRDIQLGNEPSTNIYTVVTITEVKRPRKGDVVYSASAGKYRGYVSTAASTTWKNFN